MQWFLKTFSGLWCVCEGVLMHHWGNAGMVEPHSNISLQCSSQALLYCKVAGKNGAKKLRGQSGMGCLQVHPCTKTAQTL